MPDLKAKKYPPATNEVSKIFGLHEEGEKKETAENGNEVSAHAVGDLPVADLPVADTSLPRAKHEQQPTHTELQVKPSTKELLHEKLEKLSGLKGGLGNPEDINNPVKVNKWISLVRVIATYLFVFLIGVLLYFFFFSNMNFSSIIPSRPVAITPQESALEKLEKQSLSSYYAWVNQFYYDVSDTSVIDPNVDNSGNGLTNFQKYLLNLNPKAYDTLGLGMPDSQALAQGVNPLTGGKLTDAQQQIINQYFDMEVIMNRLALEQMQRNNATGMVAGAHVAQAAGLPNYTGGNPTGFVASSTGNSGSVVYAELDIDTTKPGRLQIPSLKVDAPLIWSTDPSKFEDDLKSGVIHYPGTAMPGQIGTSYISGHSSNYAWVKGNYNHVFTQLGNLANDASFSITVTLKNGKQVTLHYVVTGSKVYQPNDQVQFMNSGSSIVNLSTCWPIGTTQKRLVATGILTQVDQ